MADDQKKRQDDEQKAAEDQRKAEAEALAADPIGGKPPIDVAYERAQDENAEPPGYVDPASQEQPEGYSPDPEDVENPPVKEPKKSAKAKGKEQSQPQGQVTTAADPKQPEAKTAAGPKEG